MPALLNQIIAAASDAKSGELKALIQSANEPTSRILHALREKGCFRCSGTGFDDAVPKTLVKALLERQPSDADVVYLKSVSCLLTLSGRVRAEQAALVKAVNARSFRSYLTAVDALFQPHAVARSFQASHRFDAVPKEKVAAAFSSYAMYFNERGLRVAGEDVNSIYGKKIRNGDYERQLERFGALNHFREAELLVDAYGYTVRPKDGIGIVVEPPSSEFGIAQQLGFIRQATQIQADLHDLEDEAKQMASLYEGAESLMNEKSDSFLDHVSGPYSRLRFKILRHPQILSLFSSPALYREEYVQIRLLAKELFIDFKQLSTTPISGSLTLLDLVRFKRVFVFITGCFYQYCLSRNFLGSDTYLRSIVSLLPLDSKQNFLAEFFPREKLEEILQLLSYDPTKGVFDVQYQPLVRVEGHYFVPTGILATSNIARNSLLLTRYRFYASGLKDPLSGQLAEHLEKQGFTVRQGISYQFAGHEGEVDVLAVRDDAVFVFECKNSLLPCNEFELRTSWDYVQKASKQLNAIETNWGKPGFIQLLQKGAGVTLPVNPRLGTCIVTGNRMFPGLLWKGQPVRPLFELCTFIRDGLWTLETDIEGTPLGRPGVYDFSLWQGATLQVADIFFYLGPDSVYGVVQASMEKSYYEVNLGGAIFRLPRFALNYATLCKNAVAKWRYTYRPNAAEASAQDFNRAEY